MKDIPLCKCQETDYGNHKSLMKECLENDLQIKTYVDGEGVTRSVQTTRCRLEAKLNEH